MSEKVDQFNGQLRDRLNTIERRLQSVKTNIQALPGQAEKVLRDKLEAARAKLQAQKERVEQTRAKLKAESQQKTSRRRPRPRRRSASGWRSARRGS
jgi:chromosome segregation ATPase